MNEFEKAQSAKILGCYGVDIEKGGEGSKGGKVIGHTKTNKPIYENHHKSYSKFTQDDHQDAVVQHKINGNEFGEDYHRERYNSFNKSID